MGSLTTVTYDDNDNIVVVFRNVGDRRDEVYSAIGRITQMVIAPPIEAEPNDDGLSVPETMTERFPSGIRFEGMTPREVTEKYKDASVSMLYACKNQDWLSGSLRYAVGMELDRYVRARFASVADPAAWAGKLSRKQKQLFLKQFGCTSPDAVREAFLTESGYAELEDAYERAEEELLAGHIAEIVKNYK